MAPDRSTNRSLGIALACFLSMRAAPLCAAEDPAADREMRDPDTVLVSTCQSLRDGSKSIDDVPETYTVIEVSGTVSAAQFDGTLAYVVVCAPPDPQVLCIAYSANGLKAGDTAVVRGGYTRRGPDHIMLDPCLALAG